jgi:hypothetical protein
MSTARALKRPAIFCALILAFCTLASYPFVEMGQCDDFAYVRSAKTLAETGHIIYYGWASAMLGWQLALGALFIKLFGFSFTTTHASMLLIAVATTFFLQRTFVHLGLREANASFATLTLVLSPLFIPLSFGFMSDISGVFAIVLCLYFCLRAFEAPVLSQTTAWLITAFVSNAILGTARQTGWLGLLVIVPSSCWLLRRRRLPFFLLTGIWSLCVVFVFACLHWFGRQMYSTVESFEPVHLDRDHLFNATTLAVCVILEAAFFLAPILIAFILPFVRHNKRLMYVALAGVIIFCTYFLIRPDSYWAGVVLAPALNTPGNYVTSRGTLDLPEIGLRPVVLQPGTRVVITVICYFAAFAFFVVLFTRNRGLLVRPSEGQLSKISMRQMLLLLGPFTLAYCTFLAFRVFSGFVFDRYLLPLFVVFAVIAVRFYQERVSPRLPGIAYAALVLFAAYGVAATHDMFAENRARLAATEQFRKAGLPRTDFYGGFPYDGWTQIEARGFVDSDGIVTPTGVSHYTKARVKFKPCGYWHARYFSAIKPEYVLSYDNFTCGDSQDKFAPVPYHLWLPPFSGVIYSRRVNPEEFLMPEN